MYSEACLGVFVSSENVSFVFKDLLFAYHSTVVDITVGILSSCAPWYLVRLVSSILKDRREMKQRCVVCRIKTQKTESSLQYFASNL